MNKLFLIMLGFLVVSGPIHQAFADAKNSKIVVTVYRKPPTGDPMLDNDDCKISIKEIENWNGKDPGQRYVCTQISAVGDQNLGNEMIPESLKGLVDQNQAGKIDLVVGYTGNDVQNLLKTFAVWQNHLATNEKKPQVLDWTLELVSQSDSAAVLRYSNATAGSSFEFSVELNHIIVGGQGD